MKILNLYAAIGGNIKLIGEEHEVTAVEIDPKIAGAYIENYPNHTMIIGDAHQYLLDHYQEYDFIWCSPPCQRNSKMIRGGRNRKPIYPDLMMYEEIIFLQYNFKGMWAVENVDPYYKPLIEPTVKLGRHLIWSNFPISVVDVPEFPGFIKKQNLKAKEELHEWIGIRYTGTIYYNGNHCPTQVLRNAVHPVIGKHVFDEMIKALKHKDIRQGNLFNQ